MPHPLEPPPPYSPSSDQENSSIKPPHQYLIRGEWSNGATSKLEPATLYAEGDVWTVILEHDPNNIIKARLEDLTISDRLSNTPRKVKFPPQLENPSRGIFVTTDNDAIDSAYADNKTLPLFSFIAKIEGSLKMVVLSCLTCVLVAITFHLYAMPYIASSVANRVPQEYRRQLDEGILKQLKEEPSEEEQDENILEKITNFKMLRDSELPLKRQQELKTFFLKNTPKQFAIRILFFDGDIGPNAFALPGGTILFTDDLVQLMKNDTELLGIYFHELAHVEKNHGLRSVVQHTFYTLLMTYIIGDISGVADTLTGGAIFLGQQKLSRNFEYEADERAIDYLILYKHDPQHFIQSLEHLNHYYIKHTSPLSKQEKDTGTTNSSQSDKNKDEGNSNDPSEESSDSFKSFEFLSTHPDTNHRIKHLENYIKLHLRKAP